MNKTGDKTSEATAGVVGSAGRVDLKEGPIGDEDLGQMLFLLGKISACIEGGEDPEKFLFDLSEIERVVSEQEAKVRSIPTFLTASPKGLGDLIEASVKVAAGAEKNLEDKVYEPLGAGAENPEQRSKLEPDDAGVSEIGQILKTTSQVDAAKRNLESANTFEDVLRGLRGLCISLKTLQKFSPSDTDENVLGLMPRKV